MGSRSRTEATVSWTSHWKDPFTCTWTISMGEYPGDFAVGHVQFDSLDAMRDELRYVWIEDLEREGVKAFNELKKIRPDKTPTYNELESVAVRTAHAAWRITTLRFEPETRPSTCIADFGGVVRETIWKLADILLTPPNTPMILCVRDTCVGRRHQDELREFVEVHRGIAFSCGHVRSDSAVADDVFRSWVMPCRVCGKMADPTGSPAIHIPVLMKDTEDVARMLRISVALHTPPKKDTLAAHAAAAVTKRVLMGKPTWLFGSEDVIRRMQKATGEHGDKARLLCEEEVDCKYSILRAYKVQPSGDAKRARR